ncbi:MAG: biopolymer transporter ExbD [Candidatus Acidulodesulfobacterium ferriphilum]|jgi:biopolymer transport protein ExbD|uniref:Biopolymer transporter ExbD n=1 Tax=Candidatus Acidulodesulfobacterium ferriphilum TaxID=2597223 RepID=A0A519BB23_9DELT|nr:MAG: biopolymer transporter ExbD [Candidatus Acidulodesulfobacterium ferriphilum]
MKFVQRRKPDPVINVINMVDVFLTLLIFFMMTTTFTSNYGLKIHLPKSGIKSVTESKKPVTIYITKGGRIFYKKKQLSLKQLSLFLKNLKVNGGNPTIIIKADKKSTAADIVSVMGLSVEHGFYKIAIATKK